MKLPSSLIIAALLAAGCREQPSSQIPELSAPGTPSAAGIMRQAPAKTVTASAGPVKLTLDLLETRLSRPGAAAYFRATLKNVGTTPFEYSPDFFKDPRFNPSAAGLHLEAIGPAGSKPERHPYLPVHAARRDPRDYTDDERAALNALRNELDIVVRKAREAGQDEGAAIINRTSKKAVDSQRPLLQPGLSAESASWISLQNGITPISGYAQLPFFLNAAGRYKVRLIYDYTSRAGPAAIRVATPWIEFEVAQP